MRTIEIKQNDGGQRLDKYLSKRFKTMPKSLMYKYIRTKYIKLNGKKCDKSDFVKAGDVLTLYIKDEFFEENPERNYEFLKGPDRLDILYEDENLILIDKKQKPRMYDNDISTISIGEMIEYLALNKYESSTMHVNPLIDNSNEIIIYQQLFIS